MRSPLIARFLTGLALGTLIAVALPSEAEAQRARSGGSGAVRTPPRGATGHAVPRSYHYPTHRPYYPSSRYYRPYYYRPYYGSYYPYYRYRHYYPYFGVGFYPFYAPYYRPYWNVGFSFGYGWGGYPYGYWPYGYGYGYGGYYPPYDPMGEARLQVTPRETEVFVNGYFAGVVDDFDGMSQRLRLAPGEHEIELHLRGHRPWREKLMFTVGNTLRVRHEMEPLPPGEPQPDRPKPQAAPARPAPPDPYSSNPGPRPNREPPREPAAAIAVEPSAPASYGSLAIRIQPYDAELFIDGEVWTSPDPRKPLIVQLREGVYLIEVRKRGFSTYRSEVTIRRGETATINVSLVQPEKL